MSWRRWNGWEPTEVTTYEYDEQGRVSRSVTAREPEWDEGSRAYATALVTYERSLCNCGRPLSETTDPTSEGRYQPDGAVVCHRCWAIEKSAKEWEGHHQRHSLRFDIKDNGPQD